MLSVKCHAHGFQPELKLHVQDKNGVFDIFCNMQTENKSNLASFILLSIATHFTLHVSSYLFLKH